MLNIHTKGNQSLNHQNVLLVVLTKVCLFPQFINHPQEQEGFDSVLGRLGCNKI